MTEQTEKAFMEDLEESVKHTVELEVKKIGCRIDTAERKADIVWREVSKFLQPRMIDGKMVAVALVEVQKYEYDLPFRQANAKKQKGTKIEVLHVFQPEERNND